MNSEINNKEYLLKLFGCNVMDIKSGCGYPASALSNFAPHPFVLDGVYCASMEGFLQSLKFNSIINIH